MSGVERAEGGGRLGPGWENRADRALCAGVPEGRTGDSREDICLDRAPWMRCTEQTVYGKDGPQAPAGPSGARFCGRDSKGLRHTCLSPGRSANCTAGVGADTGALTGGVTCDRTLMELARSLNSLGTVG